MKIKILDPRVGATHEWPLPRFETPGSAGFDLRAATIGDQTLYPGDRRLISTGMAIWPEDCWLLLAPRSGLAKKGIILGNSVGIIDSDYQDELQVLLWNTGEYPWVLHPGERIAQAVPVRWAGLSYLVVEEFDQETERGKGGWGHSGVA